MLLKRKEETMLKRQSWAFLTTTLFLLSLVSISTAQENLSTQDLIKKNIETAGSEEKLAQIENYSFKVGRRTYFLSSEGQMKITSGQEPIITEVILASKEKVNRNSYNNITNYEGLLKSTYQALAKLFSRFFTLEKFKDHLEFQGLKKFGPEKLYKLAAKEGNLLIEFYLDADNFALKRLVLQGFDEDRGKYEVNHDYGPLQEFAGLKIPSQWFGSQVGVRGSLMEVSDVRVNLALEKDFFLKHDVNIGEVKVSKGALTGSVIQSRFQRNMLQIGTNWTQRYIQQAGFKENDKLILLVRDMEIEIDFYDTRPPRSAYGQGGKFMMPNRGNENYIIYLISPEFSDLVENLEPLMPIQVKIK